MLFISLIAILLDGATATTGTLAEFLDKFDAYTIEQIWGTRTVGDQKLDGWYSTLIPVATSLGAVFSLILAGRIAYKSMTLDDGIDVLALLRPLLISFVLAFWWPITWSLYHISQPIEDFFRAKYEYQNSEVVRLKQVRKQLADGLYVKVDSVANEQELAERMTQQFIKENNTVPESSSIADGDDAPAEGSTQQKFDTASSYFSDILYEDDIKGEVLVNAVGDTIRYTDVVGMATTARTANAIENIILWIAEAFWTTGIICIFLIRNLFLTVLVLFGPVYIMCSLLDVWKDKWGEWVSRLVAVSLYGPLTYIALYFALLLVEMALNSDILRMKETLDNGNTLLGYIVYVGSSTIPTVGYYVICLIIGTACIPLCVELSSFFVPGDVGRGATKFYSGMQQHLNEAVDETVDKTKKAVVAVASAGVSAGAEALAERAAAKAAEQLAADTAAHTAAEAVAGAGAADAASAMSDMDAESFADRFWRDKMQELTDEEDELDATAEEIDAYIRAVEEGKDADFLQRMRERINDNARLLAIVRLGYVPESLFSSDADREAFLKKYKLDALYRTAKEAYAKAEQPAADGNTDRHMAEQWEVARTAYRQMVDTAGAVLAERKLYDMANDFDWRKEAERAADRTLADELRHSGDNIDQRIRAAEQDLDAYTRAQASGKGDQYLQAKEQRLDDNRKLWELAQGTSPTALFSIHNKERDAFLKRFGLYQAFKRQQSLQRKADKLQQGDFLYKRMKPVYQHKADEVHRLIAAYCQDILHARGIVDAPDGQAYGRGLRDRYSNGKGASWFAKVLRRDNEVHRCVNDSGHFFRRLIEGRYRTLMRIPWFRAFLSDEAANSSLLQRMQTYIKLRSEEDKKSKSSGAGKHRKSDDYLDLMFETYEVEGEQMGCRSSREFERNLWLLAKKDRAAFMAAYTSLLAMRRRARR